jgi:transcriptional regulator with GAF, ATPase, and Fis domain
MNERQDIDYLPVDLSHPSLDTGQLLNENIARIEFVKMKALEWPGVSELEKSHLMHELDILRGSLIQLTSRGHATESEPLSPMLPGAEPDDLKLEGIIGRNPKIVKALKTIAKVAPTDLTILLEGETGSGKELFARIIHLNSNRDKFVAVNCGAFPSEIIESELFGHVKGAFTGAAGDRKGKFEEADGGTIFLDEIGDLELQAQVKLLRVLELGELQRVGSDKTRQVDVKVIAATHKNLEQMVADAQFREDLYYRINMCPLWIPPLRDRRDEIEILFEYFLQEACSSTHKKSVMLNANLRDFINNRYHFPGNIRELKNIAQYLAYIAGDEPVTLSDLPERYQRYDRETPPVRSEHVPTDIRELDHVRNGAELEYLTSVLRKHHGNMKKVCREMQLSRSRVYQLLNKFNLHAADYR